MSIRYPISNGPNAAPMFKQMAITPKLAPAEFGPKISGSRADAVGGTMAAVAPRAIIEAVKAKLDVSVLSVSD